MTRRLIPALLLASLSVLPVGCGSERDEGPVRPLVQVETYEAISHRGSESPLRFFEDGRATYMRANYASGEDRLHIGRWWHDADLRVVVFRTLRVLSHSESDDEPDVEIRVLEEPLLLVLQDGGAEARCIANNFDYVNSRWRRVRVEFADLRLVKYFLRGFSKRLK